MEEPQNGCLSPRWEERGQLLRGGSRLGQEWCWQHCWHVKSISPPELLSPGQFESAGHLNREMNMYCQYKRKPGRLVVWSLFLMKLF